MAGSAPKRRFHRLSLDQCDGVALRDLIFLGPESAADDGAHAKQVEVGLGDKLAVHALGFLAAGDGGDGV